MATGESPESDPTLELLIRHTEAENGHRLDDTLATLTAECTFEDVALNHSFPRYSSVRRRGCGWGRVVGVVRGPVVWRGWCRRRGIV